MSLNNQFKAIIVDATGTELTSQERDLFASEKPAGFILFKRNCVSKQQVKELVASVRDVTGDKTLPVLIDQEGGTVARLRQPEWTEYPAAKVFGELAGMSLDTGIEAVRINAYLMALDLIEMGINVNCAPVADVPSPDCHEFLSGSRTYCDDADQVAKLGEAVAKGHFDAGVTPVMKHIPGHGRAKTDSHFDLPVVDASHADLSKIDFNPFKYLAHSNMKTGLWAMAAHVVYSAIDPDSAATTSARVVHDVIRTEIGFDGVLLADDISMKALGGTIVDRVKRTMDAGMDLTMLCNASFEDRVAALSATPHLTDDAVRRLNEATEYRTANVKNGNDNKQALQEKLASLINNKKMA